MSFTTTVNTVNLPSVVTSANTVIYKIVLNNVPTPNLVFGIVGISINISPISYFMRAWDTVNGNWVYWKTLVPSNPPMITTPSMSGVGNLVQTAIVHQIV